MRHPAEQFHDKERHSRIRGPGIQPFGNVGMIHECQGLALNALNLRMIDS